MTLKQIRTASEEQPFKPFEIHLADGRTLAVRHPEFVAFSDRSRIIIVTEPDGSVDYVDPQLVTSLRVPVVQESL